MTIFESIKTLEIKDSILFNLDFAKSTILSCFLFFFLTNDLNFVVPAATAQIFNPIGELVIPIGISIKEAKEEMETYPVIVEAKIRKCSI